MFDHNSKRNLRNGHHSETVWGEEKELLTNTSLRLSLKYVDSKMHDHLSRYEADIVIRNELPRGCEMKTLSLITRSISFHFLLVDEVKYKRSYCEELAGLK